MAPLVIFIFDLDYVGRAHGHIAAALSQPRAGRIINLADQNLATCRSAFIANDTKLLSRAPSYWVVCDQTRVVC